jgi:acyl-CoA thioesterase I
MKYCQGHAQSIPARHLPWLLLLVSFLLSGCSSDKPRLARLDADASVLAFGDSLTYGTGAKAGESYPERLSASIGRKVINAGVPGETTTDGLARLPRVLEESNPDLVILCLGGNDFLRKVDPARTRDNLERMIAMIRADNIPLVLIAVPKPGLFVSSDALYSELAKKFGLPLENEVLADVLGDKTLKSDPIHPNAQGYQQVADAIAKLLKSAGAI